MQFIEQEYSNTLEIKRSKFIVHICPYHEFHNLMKRLKDSHPKARHFVYAYRYINEFNQVVENSSDDGEPKGTSGKPSLSVLSGASIINTGVIIVRYFGGTRLGTGGLVRAYGNSVNDVLSVSTLYPYIKKIKRSINIEYSLLSQVEYILENHKIDIIEKDFSNNVNFILESSKEKFDKLSLDLFRDIKLIEVMDA